MDMGEEETIPTDSDPLLEGKDEADPIPRLSPPQPATVSTLEIDDEEADGSSAACCRICLEAESEIGDELISPCLCKGTQQLVHRSCLDHWRSVKVISMYICVLYTVPRGANPKQSLDVNCAVLLSISKTTLYLVKTTTSRHQLGYRKEGFAFSHCTTCKAQFHLRVETLEDNSWRKIKFRLFVARDVILGFLAVQITIAIISAIAYFLDRDGSFRNSFSDGWDRILSRHPIPFYYCIGVVVFFVLLGFFGLIVHCSSFNDNQDPCLAGCRNCCYGWGILDCLPASLEACFALVVVFVVVFAILGIAYGFLAATMAVQRIWQRHYHILTKRELTKEYIVEDLHGSYTAPKLEPEHEERLKMLNLL
ncbi:unnamed protein product [Alopecurus aequalis]